MTLVPSSSRGSTVTGIELTDGITDVTGATKVTASGGLVVGGTTPNATLAQGAAPAAGLGVYGDGSDGAQTFDGTTTILGIVPSPNSAVNGVYTLTRDIYLTSSTLNSGISIVTAGYRVFCQGTFTNNGTILWNGGAGAAGGSAGGSVSGGSITNQSSGAGGAGGATTGSPGTSESTRAMGGAGGVGGTGTSGAGGSGGTVSAPSTGSGSLPRFAPLAVLGVTYSNAATYATLGLSGGGGGGGGDGTAGAGGGAGGGVVILLVKTFAGTGAIQARGGAGGTPAAGNRGGGGGGGGGVVIVISASVVAGAITGQTIDAAGGAKGLPSGSGTNNAAAGNSGTVILLPN